MADPFQDVDAFGAGFVKMVTSTLENRAAEDQMIPVIDRYLDQLNWADEAIHIEVGVGTGAIARKMASKSGNGRVIGIDPSENLIANAKELADGLTNIDFEVGDGSALRFSDNSIVSVIMHTVLSHVPDPAVLLAEAMRVLKPGGKLVICDADFEKTYLGNFDGDPIDACAEYFVRNFVTHPYLISDIRKITTSLGFVIDDFRIDSRAITDSDGGLAWIKFATTQMVEKNAIGKELAIALVGEYNRRKDAGLLYGHQPFGTLVASKP